MPSSFPSGYDARDVVTRLDSLTAEVLESGSRRVDFSGIAALNGPEGVVRLIPLGLVDGDRNVLSRLESDFLQHLKVRRSQAVRDTVDGGLAVVSLLTAGDSGKVTTVVEPALLGYGLTETFTTVPEQTVKPMDEMKENEFDMSMQLVEDLANVYEVANCTQSYMAAAFSQ